MTEETETPESEPELESESPAAPAAAKPDGTFRSAFNLKPMLPLEKRVAFWVAVAGAVGTVGLWLPFMDEGGFVWMPIGVALALLLLWASQRRGRMTTAVAAFLLSFAVWPYPLVGMPFLVLGMWLWFRGRPSPEELVARRKARAEAVAARRAAKRGKPIEATGRPVPPQSKRYTPPARKR